MIETEIKIKIRHPGEIRKKLESAGAEKVNGFMLERNFVFDNERNEFRNTDRLLRVREYTGKTILTHKGPAIENDNNLKKREEIQIETSDFEKTKELLNKLGFQQKLSYEKKREKWKLDNIEIDIDEIPLLGFFLEIEGNENDISELASKLGFRKEEFITKNYVKLFQDYCEKNKIRGRRMVF